MFSILSSKRINFPLSTFHRIPANPLRKFTYEIILNYLPDIDIFNFKKTGQYPRRASFSRRTKMREGIYIKFSRKFQPRISFEFRFLHNQLFQLKLYRKILRLVNFNLWYFFFSFFSLQTNLKKRM